MRRSVAKCVAVASVACAWVGGCGGEEFGSATPDSGAGTAGASGSGASGGTAGGAGGGSASGGTAGTSPGGAGGTAATAGVSGTGGKGGGVSGGAGSAGAAGAEPEGGTSDACSSEEICNGVDDDCNGATDEGSLCEGGRVCAAGRCECPERYFECGDACHADGECSAGAGSCASGGVLLCKPGGTVGCSAVPKTPICAPGIGAPCDPCGGGSAVPGTAPCDSYGCSVGTCTPRSGVVFQDYAPSWNHGCGLAHDATGQNWRCDSNPPRQLGCPCADRTVRLPQGSYRLTVAAGLSPGDTAMLVRVMSGNVTVATSTFTVVGPSFTQHALEFQVASCGEYTFVIERFPGRFEFVINQITLVRS